MTIFTFSSWAFFFDLYKNSPTATKTESTNPAASTMKIPPIFWTPKALASLLSSSGQPLPLHHFSFIMWSLPSSCSWRIAIVILSLYGEPEETTGKKYHMEYITLNVSFFQIKVNNISWKTIFDSCNINPKRPFASQHNHTGHMNTNLLAHRNIYPGNLIQLVLPVSQATSTIPIIFNPMVSNFFIPKYYI